MRGKRTGTRAGLLLGGGDQEVGMRQVIGRAWAAEQLKVSAGKGKELKERRFKVCAERGRQRPPGN